MAIETVIISRKSLEGDEGLGFEVKFHLHQKDTRYAVDGIGQPHYIGSDYLPEEIEVLPPSVYPGPGVDLELDFTLLTLKNELYGLDDWMKIDDTLYDFKEGQIYYYHKQMLLAEDSFILCCHQPIEDGFTPLRVEHIDGNTCNNDPENLKWVYAEDVVDWFGV